MKKITSLFFTMGLVYAIHAQTDYRKGYIVTQPGDTISGLINYREGPGSFRFCDFKSAKEVKATRYYPADLKGYRFENDRSFEARLVEVDEGVTENVFLEALVKGTASLYKARDVYFIEKGEAFHRLTNEKSIVRVEGQDMLKNSNRYIGLLIYLLGDCSTLKKRIEETELREKSLTRLLESYNECVGTEAISYKDKKPWAAYEAGIVLGYYASSLSFSVNGPDYYYLKGEYSRSNTPTGGLALSLSFPRIHERLAIVANVLYVKAKYQTYNEEERFNAYERNDVLISLDELLIPVGVRYTFPERKITPYVNLGFSYDVHLQSSSLWIRESEQFNEVKTYEADAYENRTHQLGYWGGLGIQKDVGKKLKGFLELRYEQTDGVTITWLRSIDVVRSNIASFQFLVGIKY